MHKLTVKQATDKLKRYLRDSRWSVVSTTRTHSDATQARICYVLVKHTYITLGPAYVAYKLNMSDDILTEIHDTHTRTSAYKYMRELDAQYT